MFFALHGAAPHFETQQLTDGFQSAGPALGTIVHLHGNAQNMTSHFPNSPGLRGRGSLFLFSTTGATGPRRESRNWTG